jgi:hypothetical protein
MHSALGMYLGSLYSNPYQQGDQEAYTTILNILLNQAKVNSEGQYLFSWHIHNAFNSNQRSGPPYRGDYYFCQGNLSNLLSLPVSALEGINGDVHYFDGMGFLAGLGWLILNPWSLGAVGGLIGGYIPEISNELTRMEQDILSSTRQSLTATKEYFTKFLLQRRNAQACRYNS